MEACAAVGLNGVFYVMDSPSAYLKETTEKLWTQAQNKERGNCEKRGIFQQR